MRKKHKHKPTEKKNNNNNKQKKNGMCLWFYKLIVWIPWYKTICQMLLLNALQDTIPIHSLLGVLILNLLEKQENVDLLKTFIKK